MSRHKILVEMTIFALFVEGIYKNFPLFCDQRKIIGHNLDNSKRINR